MARKCRLHDPPQAENSSFKILVYIIYNTYNIVATLLQGERAGSKITLLFLRSGSAIRESRHLAALSPI